MRNPVGQKESWSRVKKTLSAWWVTVAGGTSVPLSRGSNAPPPSNVVCEKLVSTRTLGLSHQFNPAAQPVARRADVAAFANAPNVSPSMSSWPNRPTSCQAPQCPVSGLKFWRGTMPVKEAFSPVSTHCAEACQAA